MQIIKTKARIFNISQAIVWSVLAHLFFFNYLPDFSSMDSVEPKKEMEKVRLDIIKKEIPIKAIKKEVFKKNIKPVKRDPNKNRPKVNPLPVKPVQRKTRMVTAVKRAPNNLLNLKPLPAITQYKNIQKTETQLSKQYPSVAVANISSKALRASPVSSISVNSQNYAVSPHASKVVRSNNSSLSKVSYGLKPKGTASLVSSSLVSPMGRAQMRRGKRVFFSSFSPTPLPVENVEFEQEKENALSKEELDGIWKQYAKSIQVKIAKEKIYPALAKKRRQQGKAILSFKLNRDGKVFDLRVEKSSGYETLDQAARRAIEKGEPYPLIPETLNKKYAYFKIPISFVPRRGR